MVPYDPENEDEAYYGYGRQEGHAKPNSNQSSRSSTTKQVSQLLLGLVGTLFFKIMIFSPHKECGGRSPFHKECRGRSPKSATFESWFCLGNRSTRTYLDRSRGNSFKKMTKSKKNTSKTLKTHTRITSSSLRRPLREA